MEAVGYFEPKVKSTHNFSFQDVKKSLKSRFLQKITIFNNY